MDCKRVADEQLVEKYLNGQLEQSVQDALELHILECPQCRAQAEALQDIRAALAKRAQEIRAFPVKPARRFRWVWAGAAAVTLLVALLIYRLIYTNPETPHTAGPSPSAPAKTETPETPQNAGTPPHNSPSVRPSPEKPVLSKKPDHAPATAPPAPADQPKNQIPLPPAGSQVASQHPSPTPGGAKSSSPALSEEAALELYRLGTVQPPPPDLSKAGQLGTSSSSTSKTNPSGLAENPATSRSSLFQKAMLAYMDKNYAEAGDLLDRAAQAEPEALNVKFYLGVCRLLEGRPADSIAPLKAVVATPPGMLTQSGHFYLAKAYLQMGKLEDAENEMRAAAALPGRLTAEARSLVERIQKVRQHE